MCMCTHVHTLCVVCAVYVYTCAHKHACVGQRLRLGIFLNYCPLYLGGTNLLLNPELTYWSLSSQQTPVQLMHPILFFPALELQALVTVLDFVHGH